MLDTVFSLLWKTFPSRQWVIGEGYLQRFIFWRTKRFGSLYLHRFTGPDAQEELHSHPWVWATSLVLSGAYWERVLEGEKEYYRKVSRFRFRILRGATYHRIVLLDVPTFTLFWTGSKVKSWGFLVGGQHVDYRTFLMAKGAPIYPGDFVDGTTERFVIAER